MNSSRIVRTGKGTGESLASVNAPVDGNRGADAQVLVDGRKRYQTIRGFGGALTESAAYTLSRVSEEVRERVLADYFNVDTGHAYSMARLHIHSCDFSLGNYTYINEGDASLDSFDMAREEKHVLPALRRADQLSGKKLFLLASPWSPPGWMKTNGEMNNGGKLLPEHRDTWARYMARYAEEMKAKGLPLSAITVQNEPAAVQNWDSCLYSGEEERDFVRDHLGPTLYAHDLKDLKLLVWDHNRDIVFERAQAVLSDPEAARFVWGVAHHWYLSEEFENLSRVHEAYPDTHLIFTEGCQEGGVHLGDWSTGERYARNIIGDLRNWVEGWIDWNIVLDETGGPNHVGNFCDAPIIVDTSGGEVHHNSSYWYIGHFSRFIPPGSHRLDSAEENPTPGLSHLSVQTPDGATVTILLNESDADLLVEIKQMAENGQSSAGAAGAKVELPGHSIASVVA